MTDTTEVIKAEDAGRIIQEIEERFFDIPFENSDFQNKCFVENAQITPARAYRAIGLRIHAKLRAVKEYKYNLQLQQVDIDEKRALINNPDASEFDKRRAEIEIAKMQDTKRYEEKLLNDALREITFLYNEMQKFPKYTREQFEAEERKHFELLAEQRTSLNGNDSAIMLSNMSRSQEIIDTILELYADDPAMVLTYEKPDHTTTEEKR